MSVETELDLIQKRHRGILRPEDVVAFAENPETDLHAKFTWDDTEAAREFRLEQARRIIRCVVFVEPNTKKKYRVYASVSSDRMRKGGGYRTLVSVMSDADMRADLLYRAMEEARIWQERYHDLQELASIFAEMDQVAKQIRPKAKRKKA